MKIYGYTTEKEMVQVDLSIDQIAVAGIYPWRLDLFDPDPVTLVLDGQMLSFQRFRNQSFAFRRKGGTFIVARNDGTDTLCFQGEAETDYMSAKLTNITPSEPTFAQVYREYLELFLTHIYLKAKPDDLFEPEEASAVTIHGTTIYFKRPSLKPRWFNGTKGPANQFEYCGTMLSETQFPFQTPDQINQVFKEFPEQKPIVFGRAIQKALHGLPVSRVEMLVTFADYKSIRKQLETRKIHLQNLNNFGWPYQFRLGDCRYLMKLRWEGGSTVANQLISEEGHGHSIDHLYCTRENELCGSRLAFHDVGAHQARVMFSHFWGNGDPEVTTKMLAKRRRKLVKTGFNVIPYPCIEDSLPGTYRELNEYPAITEKGSR